MEIRNLKIRLEVAEHDYAYLYGGKVAESAPPVPSAEPAAAPAPAEAMPEPDDDVQDLADEGGKGQA